MTQQEINEALTKLNKKVFGNNDSSWEQNEREQNENKVLETVLRIENKYLIIVERQKEIKTEKNKFFDQPTQKNGDFTNEQIVGIYKLSDQLVQIYLGFLNETNDDVEYITNYFSNRNDKIYNSKVILEGVDEIIKVIKRALDTESAVRSCFELLGVTRAGLQSKESIEKRFVQLKKLINESEHLDEGDKEKLLEVLDNIKELWMLRKEKK